MPTRHHNTHLERYPQHSSRQVLSHGWFLLLQDCLSNSRTAATSDPFAPTRTTRSSVSTGSNGSNSNLAWWSREDSICPLFGMLAPKAMFTHRFQMTNFLVTPSELGHHYGHTEGHWLWRLHDLFVFLSVWLLVWLLAWLFVCLFDYLFVCLFVCLFVSLNISMSKAPQLLVSATIRLP